MGFNRLMLFPHRTIQFARCTQQLKQSFAERRFLCAGSLAAENLARKSPGPYAPDGSLRTAIREVCL
jgi:hypothetical protein